VPFILPYQSGTAQTEIVDEMLADRDEFLSEVRTQLTQAQEYARRQYDAHHRDLEFKEGDIPEHFEPGPTTPAGRARARPALGPPTNLTGRAWVEILKPVKKFLARARPEMLFSVVLHYKMRGRLAQARARPEPGLKIEARCVQWDGHGQDFFGPK
jgi:hypothetical protein